MAKNLKIEKNVCNTNVFINLLQKDEPTILAILKTQKIFENSTI